MKARSKIIMILTDFGVAHTDAEVCASEILYAPRPTRDFAAITRESIRTGKIRVDTPDGPGLVVDVAEPVGAPAQRYVRVYLDDETPDGIRLKNYRVVQLMWDNVRRN